MSTAASLCALKLMYTREDCLALVERSPAAVAAHDKQAWLDMFARNYSVEDPVGSLPHVPDPRDGHALEPLSRFYDTFIAPNDIRFHVEQDFVCGLQVMRDLTMEIRMSPRVVVQTPMHLLYELCDEQGELKIARLAAHWEMRAIAKQQMAYGLASLAASMRSTVRILRYLGLGGLRGFMQGASGIGDTGKQQVQAFFRSCNDADIDALQGLCSAADMQVALPSLDEQISLLQLLTAGGQFSLGKMLAAGNTVSASYSYTRDNRCSKGVALFQLEPQSASITRLNLYCRGKDFVL